MKSPEEIKKRLAEIAVEFETANRGVRRDLNVERSVLRWVLGHNVVKIGASKIVKNHLHKIA